MSLQLKRRKRHFRSELQNLKYSPRKHATRPDISTGSINLSLLLIFLIILPSPPPPPPPRNGKHVLENVLKWHYILQCARKSGINHVTLQSCSTQCRITMSCMSPVCWPQPLTGRLTSMQFWNQYIVGKALNSLIITN